MTRPTQYPDWALQTYPEEIETVKEGVKIKIDVTNKLQPPSYIINYGFTAKNNEVPRQYANYQFNLIGQWIRTLADELTSLEQRVNLLNQNINK